jgi:hypothetical protein
MCNLAIANGFSIALAIAAALISMVIKNGQRGQL